MINEGKFDIKLYETLKNDCEKCFGLCCVALYFSASDGFPVNKKAGKPCINLKGDFSCAIHKDLTNKGLRGCTSYDCFGAGQKVAQITYERQDWSKNPQLSSQMFTVFPVMRQLHEMLWYLTEAFLREKDNNIRADIDHMRSEIEKLTHLEADSILKLDIASHREKVNSLLQKTGMIDHILDKKKGRDAFRSNKTIAGRADLIGEDLRKADLRYADLAGAFLIAADLRGSDLGGANLIGADLRDADIRGADLTQSLFVTQSQINAAKGDAKTKLPAWIDRPTTWDK